MKDAAIRSQRLWIDDFADTFYIGSPKGSDGYAIAYS